jgi:hypothetical protein
MEGVDAYFGCKRGERKFARLEEDLDVEGQRAICLLDCSKRKFQTTTLDTQPRTTPLSAFGLILHLYSYGLRAVWIRDVLNNSISFLE